MLRCLPYANYPKFHPLMSNELGLGGSVNGLVWVYHHNCYSCSITCVGIWNPATNQYTRIFLLLQGLLIYFGSNKYIKLVGIDPETSWNPRDRQVCKQHVCLWQLSLQDLCLIFFWLHRDSSFLQENVPLACQESGNWYYDYW